MRDSIFTRADGGAGAAVVFRFDFVFAAAVGLDGMGQIEVAQTSPDLSGCRRFPTCQVKLSHGADWKPATQQVGNLRYAVGESAVDTKSRDKFTVALEFWRSTRFLKKTN